MWPVRLTRILGRRYVSSAAPASPGFPSRMSGWELHEYGDFSQVLELHQNLRVPKITDPKELLVRVTASSVNPLDLAMTAGYGASLLNLLRRDDVEELPLRLGRDFCGEIVYRGAAVNPQLAKGEIVWGVVPPHRPGCHAELVKVHQDHVTLRPHAFTDEQAGVTPYAALTAWSGLFISGNLGGCGGNSKAAGKKILILGGAGGVGSMAVQICRAEDCHVVATGSPDAEQVIRSLGADDFIDYTRTEDYDTRLRSFGAWDVILDCAGRGTDYAAAHGWEFKNFVTFSSPLLKNIDAAGVFAGGLQSVQQMVQANCRTASQHGGAVKWGYFVAHPRGLNYLKRLAEEGKLKPVISHRVGFRDLPSAFKLLQDGHLRGKIAINGF